MTTSSEQELREQIKAQLCRAYYNGLDRKGWSQFEEDDAIDAIMRLIKEQVAVAVEEATTRLNILGEAYSATIMRVYDGEPIEKVEPQEMKRADKRLSQLKQREEK